MGFAAAIVAGGASHKRGMIGNPPKLLQDFSLAADGARQRNLQFLYARAAWGVFSLLVPGEFFHE
jgi:hypothetical protein